MHHLCGIRLNAHHQVRPAVIFPHLPASTKGPVSSSVANGLTCVPITASSASSSGCLRISKKDQVGLASVMLDCSTIPARKRSVASACARRSAICSMFSSWDGVIKRDSRARRINIAFCLRLRPQRRLPPRRLSRPAGRRRHTRPSRAQGPVATCLRAS